MPSSHHIIIAHKYALQTYTHACETPHPTRMKCIRTCVYTCTNACMHTITHCEHTCMHASLQTPTRTTHTHDTNTYIRFIQSLHERIDPIHAYIRATNTGMPAYTFKRISYTRACILTYAHTCTNTYAICTHKCMHAYMHACTARVHT